MTLKSRIISAFAGALFASSWFLVLDGVSISNIIRDGIPSLLIPPNLNQPRFYWYYITPCVLASLFVVLLNLVSIKQLYEDDFSQSLSIKVRMWVFTMVSGLTICLGSTIWINAVNFKDAYNAWPGITLILNVVCQIFCGILFFGIR